MIFIWDMFLDCIIGYKGLVMLRSSFDFFPGHVPLWKRLVGTNSNSEIDMNVILQYYPDCVLFLCTVVGSLSPYSVGRLFGRSTCLLECVLKTRLHLLSQKPWLVRPSHMVPKP